MVTEVAWVAAVVQVQFLTQELQSALGVAKKKKKLASLIRECGFGYEAEGSLGVGWESLAAVWAVSLREASDSPFPRA